MKYCKMCNTQKPVEAFSKKSKAKDGLQAECRSCQSLLNKKWKNLNQDQVLKARKDRYELNKDRLQTYGTEYYELNRDARLQYAKEFRKNNPDYLNRYNKSRRAVDIAYKFIHNLRVRQKGVLKGKTSTTKGLGCSSEALRIHISSQWTEGMSWDNYGWGIDKWVIDHIIPLASYEKDQKGEWNVQSSYNKTLIHYSNMQPMWFLENAQKSNKLVAVKKG